MSFKKKKLKIQGLKTGTDILDSRSKGPALKGPKLHISTNLEGIVCFECLVRDRQY